MRSIFVGFLAFALFLDPWNSAIVVGVPFGVLIRVFVVLAALPLLYVNMYRLNKNIWIVLFAGLLLVWVLIANLNHTSIPESTRSVRYYSIGILTSISIVMIGLSRNQLKLVVWSQVIGCIWAVYLMQSGAIALEIGGRAAVDGINGNYTAYCCVHAASLLVVMWREQFMEHEVSKRYSTFVGVALVILLYGTILPSTRGAFMGMCLILGMTVLGFPSRKLKYKFLISFLAIGLMAIILMNSPSLIARIRGEDSQDYGSYRPILWAMAWVLFKGSPMLGIGPGQYAPAAFGMPVHNVFLAVLTELGLIGFVFFLGFLITVILRTRRVHGQYNSWIFWAPWCLIAMTGAWESAYTAFVCFGLMMVESSERTKRDQLIP